MSSLNPKLRMRKVKKMTNEQAINWLVQIKGRYIFGGDEKFDELRREALDLAIKALENERPQSQGKWICTFHSTFPQYESDEYRCSICNSMGNKTYKFCKNCGAKMRSNEKETTFDDYLKEQLKDPEFRKEYEKLCDEDKQKGGKE